VWFYTFSSEWNWNWNWRKVSSALGRWASKACHCTSLPPRTIHYHSRWADVSARFLFRSENCRSTPLA
jgi:hypothetical protein